MQIVILCGGKGTRMESLTDEIPKPLVLIGDKPILWDIMKKYAKYGHKDFILCLGYLGIKIKEHFSKDENKEKDWNITFVDTGVESNKGERLKKIKDYIKDGDFLVAYGDDLSDVDINSVLELHLKKNKIATLTAVNLVSQFGVIEFDNEGIIQRFREKPNLRVWINGGFFVFNKKIFNFIEEGWDLEKETFEKLASIGEIVAYKHTGFWKCMNIQKDVVELNEMWKRGELQKLLGY